VSDSVTTVARDAVPWLSVKEMIEVDRLMIEEFGISLVRMMENAGRGVASLARRMLGGDASGARVLVLCGTGGNGGGGLVAARHLVNAGADVFVRLSSEPSRLTPVPAQQHAILTRMGVQVDIGAAAPVHANLVVDAVLGYSLTGAPRGLAAELIAVPLEAPVLSLDVPSGLELSTGSVHEPHITATATLTLAAPKHGLAHPVAGDLYLADISVPAAVYERIGVAYQSPFGAGPRVMLS